LTKKFGDDVFISGNALVDEPRIVIPVSPVLNYMLGGGIPEGSFVLTTGPAKVGKTTLCLDFAATAQKEEYASEYCPDGRHVYFFNIEGRLSDRDLRGIKHLNLEKDRFTVIRSRPGYILNAEDYLDIAESLINTKTGAIFIFDSFSQLCSSSRKESEYGQGYRDNVPIMLADFTKKVCNVLPVNRSIVMGITHIIANTSGMGYSQTSEASGRKIQYQADVKLRATYKELFPKDADNPIGQKVHWECSTSAIGPPGRKGTSFLRYGLGIDKVFEIAELSKDLGLIKQGGAWFTLPDDTKVQGFENCVEKLREKPELVEQLNKDFQEMIMAG